MKNKTYRTFRNMGIVYMVKPASDGGYLVKAVYGRLVHKMPSIPANWVEL